jgi:hypothetical protein
MPDDSLRDASRGDGQVKVESGLDTGLIEPVEELLGRDVAAGSRRERAATQAAHRRVKLGDAGKDRSEGVGLAGATGVVEVDARRKLWGLSAYGVEQRHRAGRSHRADRVAETQLVRVLRDRGGNDVKDAGWIGRTVERAVPGGRHDDLKAAARAVGQIGDLGDRLAGCGGRAPGVGQAVGVSGGDDVLELAEPGVDGAMGASRVRDQRGEVNPRPLMQLRRDRVGIGKRGNGTRRDERCDLDATNSGRNDRLEHSQLVSQRQRSLELEAVAHPDFADVD